MAGSFAAPRNYYYLFSTSGPDPAMAQGTASCDRRHSEMSRNVKQVEERRFSAA